MLILQRHENTSTVIRIRPCDISLTVHEKKYPRSILEELITIGTYHQFSSLWEKIKYKAHETTVITNISIFEWLRIIYVQKNLSITVTWLF